ncbi:mucin-6-like [Paramisgurnus dabryanus]|uniref:mucin-6-like n=1 Tax=Paramisgurnus dabryanus TaxID=90735 RepID=UPI003CCF33F4
MTIFICLLFSVSPTVPNLVTTSVPNPDHQSTICSTWGNFHFRTFDGHFYQMADTCNHILAGMCDTHVSDFNIQMQRTIVNGSVTFTSVTLELEGTSIKFSQGNIFMDDQVVSIPMNQNRIKIEGSSSSVKISKYGVTVEGDHSMVIQRHGRCPYQLNPAKKFHFPLAISVKNRYNDKC